MAEELDDLTQGGCPACEGTGLVPETDNEVCTVCNGSSVDPLHYMRPGFRHGEAEDY